MVGKIMTILTIKNYMFLLWPVQHLEQTTALMAAALQCIVS